MAKLSVNPSKIEMVKKTLSVAAPTGGPMSAAKKATQGPGTKMPRPGQLEEVVITGEREKPLKVVGNGIHAATTAIYPSILKEYVDSVNPKWSKFINTSSAETMKKSLDNLELLDLGKLGGEIEKKYFNKSGNLGEIRKQAKLDVFKRNPDYNF
jgi:hypothetical protein